MTTMMMTKMMTKMMKKMMMIIMIVVHMMIVVVKMMIVMMTMRVVVVMKETMVETVMMNHHHALRGKPAQGCQSAVAASTAHSQPMIDIERYHSHVDARRQASPWSISIDRFRSEVACT